MSNNITLGRGELWFARFKPNTMEPEGERYFGNTPEISLSAEANSLDHFDSDHGINEKDDSIPLSTSRSGSFVTDNISPDNLALFFFGSTTALTVTGGSFTDTFSGVIPGLTYQLGTSSTNPSGSRMISATPAPTVTNSGAPATTYVDGVDYTLDAELGRLTILKEGAITAGSDLNVTFTTTTSTRARVISGSNPISGAVRYISFNPRGEKYDWFMPYVKLTPNGDYALKGDEWQQIPFNIEVLKKPGFESLYMDGRPYAP